MLTWVCNGYGLCDREAQYGHVNIRLQNSHKETEVIQHSLLHTWTTRSTKHHTQLLLTMCHICS